MKEHLNLIISNTIEPLLKEWGYKKKSLNFRKRSGDLIFIFNVQNSQSNTLDSTKFYINCGIYSILMDKTVDELELKEPKAYDCHYEARISQIIKSKDDGYLIDKSTDLELLKLRLKDNLMVVLAQFEEIRNIQDLTSLIINHNCVDYFLFEYLIRTNNKSGIYQQLEKVKQVWSGERRWNIIMQDFDQILKQYGKETTVSKILGV